MNNNLSECQECCIALIFVDMQLEEVGCVPIFCGKGKHQEDKCMKLLLQ